MTRMADGGWKRELIEAATEGPWGTVRDLLGRVPEGEDAQSAFDAALLAASHYARPEVCEILLSAGALPAARDEHGRTAAEIGCRAKGGAQRNGERARRLLEASAPGAEYPRAHMIEIVNFRRMAGGGKLRTEEDIWGLIRRAATAGLGRSAPLPMIPRSAEAKYGYVWLTAREATKYDIGLREWGGEKGFRCRIVPFEGNIPRPGKRKR